MIVALCVRGQARPSPHRARCQHRRPRASRPHLKRMRRAAAAAAAAAGRRLRGRAVRAAALGPRALCAVLPGPSLTVPWRGRHDAPSSAPAPVATAACWHCGAPLSGPARLLCDQCGHGQPVPPHTTYFDVFGCAAHTPSWPWTLRTHSAYVGRRHRLPAAYEIDMAHLRRAFLALQQRLHPDRFTLHSEVCWVTPALPRPRRRPHR
jgi:hypothetical protein